jgi:hypothetical protein
MSSQQSAVPATLRGGSATLGGGSSQQKRFRSKLIADCWLLIAIIGALAVPAWACPMCKVAMEQTADPQHLTRWGAAFSVGVLTMVSMPFLLVGVIGWQIARHARRATSQPPPS